MFAVPDTGGIFFAAGMAFWIAMMINSSTKGIDNDTDCMNRTDVQDNYRHIKTCRTGKWYYSDDSNGFSQTDEFRQLEKPPKDIHDKAKIVIEKYNAGQKEERRGAPEI